MMLFIFGAIFGAFIGIGYMALVQITAPDDWKEIDNAEEEEK